MPTITPKQRFALWAIAVTAALAAPAILHINAIPPRTLLLIATTILSLALTTIAILLVTTPPDAIKLPAPLSVIITAAGTIWFLASAGYPLEFILSIAAGLILAPLLIPRKLQSKLAGPFVWSVILFIWHPIALTPSTATSPTALLSPPQGTILVIAFFLVLASYLLIASHLELDETLAPPNPIARYSFFTAAILYPISHLLIIIVFLL